MIVRSNARIAPALLTLLSVLLVSCGESQPSASVTTAKVERDGAKLNLSWTVPADQSVDIYVGSDPSAAISAMTSVAKDVHEQTYAFTPDAKTRPYFAFAVHEAGKGLRVAERLLPLKGGRNFRDLGGYQTSDGKEVRWGVIYRSGTMHQLTSADYGYLAGLGIKVICDLRSQPERAAEPTIWEGSLPETISKDYESQNTGLGAVIAAGPAASEESASAAMMEIYQGVPEFLKEPYGQAFKRLATGQVPLAFNCTAGKDRSGILAALILTALGVPKETVDADYLLSDKLVDYSPLLADMPADDPATPPFMRLPRAARAAILKVDQRYLDAAFAAITKAYGSVDDYFHKGLGLTDAELAQMRANLTEDRIH